MNNVNCPVHTQQYAHQLNQLGPVDEKGIEGYLWYNNKQKKFKVFHNRTDDSIGIQKEVNGPFKYYRRLSMHEINKWTHHYLPILKSHPLERKQAAKGLTNILNRRIQHVETSSICHFIRTVFEHLYNWLEGWGWKSSTTVLEEMIEQLPVPDEVEEADEIQPKQKKAKKQEEPLVEEEQLPVQRAEKKQDAVDEPELEEEIAPKLDKPGIIVPLPVPAVPPAPKEPVTIQDALALLVKNKYTAEFPPHAELAHWTVNDWKIFAQQLAQHPDSNFKHVWQAWLTLQELIQHHNIEDPSFLFLDQLAEECEKSNRLIPVLDILSWNLMGVITKHAAYSKMQDGLVKWIVQAPSLPASKERLKKLTVGLFANQLTKPNQTAFLSDDQRFRFFLAYKTHWQQITMESVRDHFTQSEINLYGNKIDLKTLVDDPLQLSAFLDTLETEQKEEASLLLLYILSARPDVKAEHLMIIYKWIDSYKNTAPYYFFLNCFFKAIDSQQKWDWFIQEIKNYPSDDKQSVLRTYLVYHFQQCWMAPGTSIRLFWKDTEWGILYDSPKEERQRFLKAWKQHDPDLLEADLKLLITKIRARPEGDYKTRIIKMYLKEIALDNLLTQE